jgi:outer membrane autotransporter protein
MGKIANSSGVISGSITNKGRINGISNTFASDYGRIDSIINKSGAYITGQTDASYDYAININQAKVTTGITNESTASIVGGISVTGYGSNVASINNAGTICAVTGANTCTGSTSGIALNVGPTVSGSTPTIGTITNTGSITGGSGVNDYGISNAGVITALNNTGTITGSYGIYNNHIITTLNNAQSNLTYKGTLPVNYNIIINSTSNFGKLAVTSGTGSTAFGINVSSTVSNNHSYSSVLSGINASQVTNTSGTYGGYSWLLSLQSGSSTIWDLLFGSVGSPSSSGSSGPFVVNTVALISKSLIGAATALDSVIDSGNASPEMQEIIDRLRSFGTEREVSDAVSETLPLQTGGMSQSIRNSLRGSNRIIQARQEGQHGRSSGDEFFGDQHAWFKPFGSWTNQDDRNGVSGFDANTYGMVFGADAEISDTNRLGVAFSYARSNIDSNSNVAKQTADVNSYQLALYGSHNFSDATDLNFQFDLGKHDNEGLRDITFASTTAKSDYTSWSAHLGAGLAHTFTLSDKTSLTPSVRADYTRIRDESYNETGAGGLNLRVNSNTTEELVLGVDSKLAHSLTDSATFTANLGLGYDVINEQASLTSAFAGAPTLSFTTKGLDPSPWLMRGGLGIVSKATETVEISARYDIEARKDFDNQTASVKVRWAF